MYIILNVLICSYDIHGMKYLCVLSTPYAHQRIEELQLTSTISILKQKADKQKTDRQNHTLISKCMH